MDGDALAMALEADFLAPARRRDLVAAFIVAVGIEAHNINTY